MQKKEYAAISAPKLGSEHQRKNIDRILVRDYLQLIEIGAFQSEYKVKQRVSFNVSLEVKPQSFPLHDNVDCVLSYDGGTLFKASNGLSGQLTTPSSMNCS